MNSKQMLVITFVACCLCCSCERKSNEYASAKPVLGAPVYTVEEAVSRGPGAAFIEEIAPKLVSSIDGAALHTELPGVPSSNRRRSSAGVSAARQSPYVTGDNVERLASIMLFGLTGPVNVLGATYQGAMAGLGAQFNDEELAAIGTHVRTSWSNKAAPVEAKTFAAMRQKWGSRGPFNIQELGEEK